jgi:hypothetical protein
MDETVEFLAGALSGKAEVWRTEEAFRKGLFGLGAPTRKFVERVGNVLVLPYPGETIWAFYPGSPRPHTMRGYHGGLSSEEMFIPFAAAVLADILEP